MKIGREIDVVTIEPATDPVPDVALPEPTKDPDPVRPAQAHQP
jgi:hypothetical protein